MIDKTRSNPAVPNYITAENTYTEKMIAHNE